MRLTNRKSLERTEELWRYMEETGSDSKSDWPDWEKYDDIGFLCFLCDYDERAKARQGGEHCSHCPLYGKWGGFVTCSEYGKAPYSIWDNAETKEQRQAAAKVIADLCHEELLRLKGGRHENTNVV